MSVFSAVALITADEPAVVRLFWIFHIVQDVADCCPHRTALAGMQRHEAGGGYYKILLI